MLKPSQPSSWRTVLVLFFLTSMIESLGMSHVFSFLPLYLQSMKVTQIPIWVGLLNALVFVVGLPLVPLWGVWANRYSAKAVIIRSAFVEAIVFGVLGVTHSFSGVVAAMICVGFQLGNTGIMLSSIRNLVPSNKIGFSISLFSVSSPIGAALGPLGGGWLVDHTSMSLHGLYLMDAGLSLLICVFLLAFYREFRPIVSTPDSTSAWKVAFQSVKTLFGLRIIWYLFGVYTLLMIARQMANPFLPLVIEGLNPFKGQAPTLIGILMGLSALVGAIITIVAGKVGDSIGFTRVLLIAFLLNAIFVSSIGFTHHLFIFGISLTAYSAATSIGSAMIFTLLSTQIPENHRTTALNLVYLPLYFGGIMGPVLSTLLSKLGMATQFLGSGFLFAVAGLLIISWNARKKPSSPHNSISMS